MSLRKQQSLFVKAVGYLISYAHSLGYELTFGDTYAGKFLHRHGSFHDKGLAIDLNLFKNGVYLDKTSDHILLGEYWKLLGGSWGGDWEDGNHYSWGESKK